MIMVGNNYYICVVVAIYVQLVLDGYLFICVGDSWFFGAGWFSSFFQEQAYRYLTVSIHRVLDDVVAATHTTSACVYIATRRRKEID